MASDLGICQNGLKHDQTCFLTERHTDSSIEIIFRRQNVTLTLH